eukprot:scaffold3823_cov195-Amphora_coffeaeformis.AAC.13
MTRPAAPRSVAAGRRKSTVLPMVRLWQPCKRSSDRDAPRTCSKETMAPALNLVQKLRSSKRACKWFKWGTKLAKEVYKERKNKVSHRDGRRVRGHHNAPVTYKKGVGKAMALADNQGPQTQHSFECLGSVVPQSMTTP